LMVSRKNNLYPKRRSNALIFYYPLTTDSAEEAENENEKD